MTRNWREYLSGGGYLVLPLLAVQVGSRAVWLFCLAGLLSLSLVTWLLNLRRLRAIADTPTSRVASAAQGYVELVGVGRPLPGDPTISISHQLPCLWYRYRRSERRNDKWVEVDAGESWADFVLDDGSGRCLLHPGEAEVLTRRKETYHQGDFRIEEELLLEGDRLYALGDFVSLGGGHAIVDDKAELHELLTDWKADQGALHRRFDLDSDGRIDAREWGLVRAAAGREVEQRRRAVQAEPVTHYLRKPRDGRPHLVAAFPPESLASRYRWRTRLHGLVMLASLFGLALTLPG